MWGQFQICLGRKQGYLAVGGFASNGNRTAMISDKLYQLDFDVIKVNNDTHIIKEYKIVLDSATSLVFFPSSVGKSVIENVEQILLVKKYITSKHVMNEEHQSCFETNLSIEIINKALPTITFSRLGLEITTWSPEFYTIPNDKGFCLAMITWATDKIVLGAAFFQGKLVSFDLDKREVSFKLSNCGESAVVEELSLVTDSGKKDQVTAEKENVSILKEFVKEHYELLLVVLVVLMVICCVLIYKRKRLIRETVEAVELKTIEKNYSTISKEDI